MRVYKDKSAAELLKIQKGFPALFVGKCVSCRFFEENENDYRNGICRRYAPRSTYVAPEPNGNQLETKWPEVHVMDWCGEQNEDEKKGNRFARRLRLEVDEAAGR